MFNESGNVEPLVKELVDTLSELGESFEVIVVDDGSDDDTFGELSKVAINERIRVIRFSRNFGQTAAFSAGIAAARGDTIVTIDGDLENDPKDIPKLLALLSKDYDLVSGWRKNRWQGSTLRRRIPSKIANSLISWISGVHLHDYGCMLKAYRREVISKISLYGEMHRFIPAYAKKEGARIAEIEVSYRKRRFGKSKYGLSRTFRVLLDLLFIKFLMDYLNRPIHFFGGIGFISLFLGLIAGLVALGLKFFSSISLVRTPLPVLATLFIIVGVQLIVMGILAELLMRTYYESQQKKPYSVKETINLNLND